MGRRTAAASRRWRQKNPHHTLWYHAKRRAREKALDFTLTPADVQALLDAGWICAYCTTPIGSFAGGLQPLSATLDRLIPERGYTPDNIVLACHRCNGQKGEHTPATMRAWADRIDAVIRQKGIA